MCCCLCFHFTFEPALIPYVYSRAIKNALFTVAVEQIPTYSHTRKKKLVTYRLRGSEIWKRHSKVCCSLPPAHHWLEELDGGAPPLHSPVSGLGNCGAEPHHLRSPSPSPRRADGAAPVQVRRPEAQESGVQASVLV